MMTRQESRAEFDAWLDTASRPISAAEAQIAWDAWDSCWLRLKVRELEERLGAEHPETARQRNELERSRPHVGAPDQ